MVSLVIHAKSAIGVLESLESYFSVAPPQLTEGDAGNKAFQFTVTCSRTFPGDVQFDYATVQRGGANAATEGVDYQAASGVGSLQAGQTQATVNVNVIGDVIPENDELFDMRFSNFRGGV